MKELLKHIIFDQREKDISQMIERDIDISLVNSPEVLVISGIRRCGKSVLLQQIRSQQTEQDYYMNFDDERLINFKVDDFQTLYEAFIELSNCLENKKHFILMKYRIFPVGKGLYGDCMTVDAKSL